MTEGLKQYLETSKLPGIVEERFKKLREEGKSY